MKNDIEWLKEQILILQEKYTTKRDISGPGNRRYYNGMLSSISLILDFINELDEPEVLSEEWVEKHTWNNHYIGKPFVYVNDLQNLHVPKQKLPVIPKFVAEWIETHLEQGFDLYPALKKLEDNSRLWIKGYNWYRENTLDFTIAYLTKEYEVEEESLYFALIKGHELMTDEGIWDCRYWNLSTSDGRVFPSNRFSQNGMYLTEMSKSEWNELDINDSNADFVKVEELEE